MRLETPGFVVSDIIEEAETFASKLAEMYNAIVSPFPYDDVRHIERTLTSRKKITRRAIAKGFIPDLSWYLSNIAGCSSWGKESLKWDNEKRILFTQLMSQDFFEKHPEYFLVRRWITEVNTPRLYLTLVLYDELRTNVLALIRLLDQLENQQNGNRTS